MTSLEKQDGPSRNSRRPGRPRSAVTQEAVLAAALRLTERLGYSRLSMEGIAAEAGVGKQTIYRWWPSKAAVVLEAFARDARAIVDVRVTGKREADLAAFLVAVSARLAGPSGIIFRSLLAEALIDPDFAAALHAHYLKGRIEDLETMLGRGAVGRGILAQVVEMTYGAIWYRLVTRQPLSAAAARKLSKAAIGLIDSSAGGSAAGPAGH